MESEMEAALAPSGAVRYKPTVSGLNQPSPRALLAYVLGAAPGFANGDTKEILDWKNTHL